jgi:hypothetical protein
MNLEINLKRLLGRQSTLIHNMSNKFSNKQEYRLSCLWMICPTWRYPISTQLFVTLLTFYNKTEIALSFYLFLLSICLSVSVSFLCSIFASFFVSVSLSLCLSYLSVSPISLSLLSLCLSFLSVSPISMYVWGLYSTLIFIFANLTLPNLTLARLV